MATPCYLITHPEVVVDPAVPVEEWHLSPAGRERAARLAALPWAATLDRLVSSAERKARETAEILAAAHGLPWTVEAALGENDRTATGFLPPAEFEAVADLFFARPTTSVRGWETAQHAQQRIVDAVRRHTAGAEESVGFVAHGAVGTLLWCDLSSTGIDRRHDQPGQGSWYAFDPVAWTAAHGWVRIG
jgi:broad specificity phosphatase PhoE